VFSVAARIRQRKGLAKPEVSPVERQMCLDSTRDSDEAFEGWGSDPGPVALARTAAPERETAYGPALFDCSVQSYPNGVQCAIPFA
jgi:hypothetical protein